MNIHKVQLHRMKLRLMQDGECSIRIKGQCMEPFVFDGDEIIITCCEKYKTGDLVLISSQNHFCLHRYLGKHKNGAIRTKGDLCYIYDEDSDLIGALSKVCYSTEKTYKTPYNHRKRMQAVLSRLRANCYYANEKWPFKLYNFFIRLLESLRRAIIGKIT